MARGLSVAAKRSRSRRWARKVCLTHGGVYRAGITFLPSPEATPRVEVGLHWGNMSNGESIGFPVVVAVTEDGTRTEVGGMFDDVWERLKKARAIVQGTPPL